jgi:hypothetical protein
MMDGCFTTVNTIISIDTRIQQKICGVTVKMIADLSAGDMYVSMRTACKMIHR